MNKEDTDYEVDLLATIIENLSWNEHTRQWDGDVNGSVLNDVLHEAREFLIINNRIDEEV